VNTIKLYVTKTVWTVGLACSYLCITNTAIADAGGTERATAQALFDEGRRLMGVQQFELACPKFEESARIIPLGGTLLNLADCYEKRGLLATAWSTFLSAATVAHRANNGAREREAQSRAAALEIRLPRITIHVDTTKTPSGTQIFRDQIVVGSGQWDTEIPIDPGQHQIVAVAPDYQQWQIVVETKQGEHLSVEIPALEPVTLPPIVDSPVVKPPPIIAPKPSLTTSSSIPPQHKSVQPSYRTSAIVTGGVGVLGIVTGATFGLLSLRKHSAADERCDYDKCRDDKGVDLRNEARLYGNISTGAFIVGALGATMGVTLWLTSPQTTSTPKQVGRFTLGPGHVSLQGVW
jgi:hypothetical protein